MAMTHLKTNVPIYSHVSCVVLLYETHTQYKYTLYSDDKHFEGKGKGNALLA